MRFSQKTGLVTGGKPTSPNPYSNQTSSTQRFFPTVGNHDSTASGTGQSGASGGIIPGYVDYFHTDPDNPNGRLPAGVHNSAQLLRRGIVDQRRVWNGSPVCDG